MAGLILDASGLLAMLRGEAGARKVADHIHEARMSAVNYAEVVSHYAKLGADRESIDAMLGPLPIEIIPADTELAAIAGMIRAQTVEAGLSLGNRFCLALASRDELPAWTADTIWADRRHGRCRCNAHPIAGVGLLSRRSLTPP